MNTVIAPYDVHAANDYSQAITSDIARGQTKHYFFRVPTSTPAFKVDLSSPHDFGHRRRAIRFIRWHPWGLGIDSTRCPTATPPAGRHVLDGQRNSRTVSNPQAGVWEVTVDARRNSDGYPTPRVHADGDLLGATVSPNPDVIASATIGVPIARSYTLTNVFGSFTGRAVGTALGSAFRATPDDREPRPAASTRSTSLQERRRSVRRSGARLIREPISTCSSSLHNGLRLAGQSADGDSEESVTIRSPVAGDVGRARRRLLVPSGSTSYNYIDVFFKTAPFGSISVTDANALRPAGSSWTVPGSVTANVAPAAGRVLSGLWRSGLTRTCSSAQATWSSRTSVRNPNGHARARGPRTSGGRCVLGLDAVGRETLELRAAPARAKRLQHEAFAAANADCAEPHHEPSTCARLEIRRQPHPRRGSA